MANDLISLENPNPVPQGDLISLDTGGPTLGIDAADRRASEADIALGEKSPGVDVLRTSFMSGQDRPIRDMAASHAAMERSKARMQAIQELAKKTQMDPNDPYLAKHIAGQKDDHDPDTILEVNLANKIVNGVGALFGGASKEVMKAFGIDESIDMTNATRDLIANRKVAQNLREEAKQDWDNAGMGTKVYETLESFIPGPTMYRLNKAAKDVPAGVGMPGTMLMELVSRANSMPPSEYKKFVYQTYDQLKAGSISDAWRFAQALEDYSKSDAAFDNVMETLNIASAVPVGLLSKGARGVVGVLGREVVGVGARAAENALKPSLMSSASNILKRVFKGTDGDKLDLGRMLSMAGDTENAAKVNATKTVLDGLKDVDPMKDSQWLSRTVFTLFNPEAIATDGSALGSTMTNRLVDSLKTNLEKAMGMIDDVKVQRWSQQNSLQVLVEEATTKIKRDFTHVNDTILDIAPKVTLPEETATNTGGVTMYLGKPTGELFQSKHEAETWGNLYNLHSNDIKPEQQGAGWVLAVSRDFDETTPRFLKTIETKTPENNVIMGFIRSAEDLLSPFQNQQRHVAQHASQRMHQTMAEIARPIAELPSKSKKDLNRVLEYYRSWVGTDGGKDVIGKFANSVGEFENDFHKLMKRFPKPAETAAYFAYRQLYDIDYVLRNMSLYRDKSIRGIQNYALHQKDMEGNFLRGPKFEGKEIDKIPTEIGADAGFFIHTNQSSMDTGRYLRLKFLETRDRAEIEDLMNNHGFKLIQVANPVIRPLENVIGTDKVIHFVLTKDVQASRLDWSQIPYRPGGHKEYGVKHFVKQPVITRITDDVAAIDPIDEKLFEGKSKRQIRADAERTYQEQQHRQKLLANEDELRAYAEGRTNSVEEMRKLLSDNYATNEPLLEQMLRKLESMPDDPKPKGISWKDTEGSGPAYGGPSGVQLPPSKASLRQPKGVTHSYEGERTAFGFHTEAEARKYAEKMDIARRLLLNKETKALSDYLEKNLPFGMDDFQSLFKAVYNEDGSLYSKASYNIDDPFVYLRDGERFSDKYEAMKGNYQNWEDNIRSPYNLFNQIDKEFAGQRDADLLTVRESGTQDRPTFHIGRAEQIDPMQTMNKAMSSLMRNRYMADYKIQAIQNWVEEFGDLIKGAASLEEVRANPMAFLYNNIKAAASDIDRVRAAETSRNALLNFMGEEAPLAKDMNRLAEKMANSIYSNYGQKWGDFAAHWLPTETDPFRYMRKFAFHTKLGMFNPVQLFLQAQTMIHSIAVSGPVNGLRGVAAGTLSRAALFSENPKVLDHIADSAARMGWNKQDFIDSFTALKKSGWHLVEGEVAWADDMFDPKLFDGKMGRALDKGTIFFKEGEKITRLTAWHTAFLDWKKANPGAVLNNDAIGKILQRADLLSVNMTRASNAAWNTGVFSLPTQFNSYSARMMEQFLGKRLTNAEKFRAFSTYSALYGVPVGMAAVAPVMPWYEDIRTEAMLRGISLDDTGMRFFMDGIPSTIFNAITGKDYNINDRWGPSGLPVMKQLLEDNDLVSAMLGPSGSIVNDTLRNLSPVLYGLASPFRSEDTQFMPTAQDAVQALSVVSTINNAQKAYIAGTLGTWMTKSDTTLMKGADTFDAFFTALTGTQPREISDAFLMMKSEKDLKKLQDESQKHITTAYKRAVQGLINNDERTYESYMAQVRLWTIVGQFREDQKYDVFKKAMSANLDVVSKVRQDFFLKGPAKFSEARKQLYTGQQ